MTLFSPFSTATGVLITPDYFFVVNLGDSRTVICTDTKLSFATSDHKPNHESERHRIIDSGGHVTNGRVNGMLAVSRAFGNFEMKRNENIPQQNQAVSALPDVSVIARSPRDNFIVICCDGVFDVCRNAEVVNFILRRIPYHTSIKDVAVELTDYSCHRVCFLGYVYGNVNLFLGFKR